MPKEIDLPKFTEEDLLNLVAAVSKVAMGLFTGNVDVKKVPIELEVPVGIAEVIDLISIRVGMTSEQMFSKLASEGLKLSLEQQLKKTKPKKEASLDTPKDKLTDQLKSIGFDPTAIMAKFDQFKELTGRLTDMQKVVENAATGINPDNTDKT